jgi:hypothetical protein
MHKTLQRVLGATRFVTSHHKRVCELAVNDYISIVMTITIDTPGSLLRHFGQKTFQFQHYLNLQHAK